VSAFFYALAPADMLLALIFRSRSWLFTVTQGVRKAGLAEASYKNGCE
jgi:hypothetical protein